MWFIFASAIWKLDENNRLRVAVRPIAIVVQD